MATPTTYFRPTGDLIYCQLKDFTTNVASGSTTQLTYGLSDLAELPGQSTWFVNKLWLTIHGFIELDGVATGPTHGRFMAGVVPRDIVGAGSFNDLADFQDYIAWPLKGMFGYTLCQGDDNPPRNAFSVSRTYTPKKALVLNREQNLTWAWYHDSGPDVTLLMSLNGQFKRGN